MNILKSSAKFYPMLLRGIILPLIGTILFMGAVMLNSLAESTIAKSSPDVSINPLGGNVGIGTTTPTESLDVIGNIQSSGTIKTGNSITINGITDTITANSGIINFDNENLTSTGTVTAGSFVGDGSALTGVSGSSFYRRICSWNEDGNPTIWPPNGTCTPPSCSAGDSSQGVDCYTTTTMWRNINDDFFFSGVCSRLCKSN